MTGIAAEAVPAVSAPPPSMARPARVEISFMSIHLLTSVGGGGRFSGSARYRGLTSMNIKAFGIADL